MKPVVLFTDTELPGGFVYPRQFKRIIDLGIVDLQPWYILEGAPLRELAAGLRARYPERTLIPFARRQDNDDIACWEVGTGDSIFIIHDFASSGWEERGRFATFYDWVRCAVEDMIEFDVGAEP